MHRPDWGFSKHLGLGHGWRHRWRRGRVFEHGDLRFVVLALVAQKPRYGYEIIKAIEEKLGGAYTPSPGVVYPTLTMLEELGYVAQSPGEGTKKLYTLTPEGQTCLDENRAVVDALLKRMDDTCAAWGCGPAPQIVRAMKNLGVALQLRFTRGPVTEQQAQAIAGAIDAAAKTAEQN